MPPKENEMHQVMDFYKSTSNYMEKIMTGMEDQKIIDFLDAEFSKYSDIVEPEPDNFVEETEDKGQQSIAEDEIVYSSEDAPELEPMGEPTVEDPQEPTDTELETLVDQTIANVFENGLDLDFILKSQCPICGYRRKHALQLTVNKNGFLHHLKKNETPANPVVGISTMCQNCGHLDLFGYDNEDLLFYLQGKGDKCHVDNRTPFLRRNIDT